MKRGDIYTVSLDLTQGREQQAAIMEDVLARLAPIFT